MSSPKAKETGMTITYASHGMVDPEASQRSITGVPPIPAHAPPWHLAPPAAKAQETRTTAINCRQAALHHPDFKGSPGRVSGIPDNSNLNRVVRNREFKESISSRVDSRLKLDGSRREKIRHPDSLVRLNQLPASSLGSKGRGQFATNN